MDMVLGVMAIAAMPLIFFAVLIPGFRGVLWIVDRILDGRDPTEGFKEWQVWVSWTIYMTAAFWCLGLAIGACSLFGWVVTLGGAA